MLQNPPYRIPLLGVNVWACHGVPAIISFFILLFATIAMWEVSSHLRPAVTVTGLWAEPRQITVADVLNQDKLKHNGALHLVKNGYWDRLCPTKATQTYSDEFGILSLNGEQYQVHVPDAVGPFDDKKRKGGTFVPIDLALRVQMLGKPQTFRFTIKNASDCPWTLFSINNDPVTATFEIVP